MEKIVEHQMATGMMQVYGRQGFRVGVVCGVYGLGLLVAGLRCLSRIDTLKWVVM